MVTDLSEQSAAVLFTVNVARVGHDGPKMLCDGWDPDGNVFQVFTVSEA